MNKSIEENIEELRFELYKLYEREGTIQSNQILEKSRELDNLILLNQKKKNEQKN